MQDKDEPLVSIITVCLNSEKTVEQTIQSVVNQTYSYIEYIIIDGQSTDGTLEIIGNYEDKISKLVSENDEGIYDAMNKGLRFTTGEIIGIINSDDWYELDAVEAVVNTFLKDRQAQVVYGNMNVYDNDNFIRTRYPAPLKELHTWMSIPHPPVFMIGEIYKKYGFNTKYGRAADRELLLKLYSHNYKFRYLDKTIANYRVGTPEKYGSPFIRIMETARISLDYADDLMTILKIAKRFLIDLAGILKSSMF